MMCFAAIIVEAQTLTAFFEGKKWGFKHNATVIIKPEYDTVFCFDKTNQIALVANKNEFNKTINPLTAEEEPAFDYYYINQVNEKLKLKAEHFPDSMVTFPDQQELTFDYLDSSNYFKLLFQDKLYLFSKSGKQLSDGYDNLVETKTKGYYQTENFAEYNKTVFRIKGLIDSAGLVIVKCKYKDVIINAEDSCVYCCRALNSNVYNDDVYNYKGKLIYTNKLHIEFSSKKIHVLKQFKPTETFIFENEIQGVAKEQDGDSFFYLKNNKGVIEKEDHWILIDIMSFKKKSVSKHEYWKYMLFLIEVVNGN